MNLIIELWNDWDIENKKVFRILFYGVQLLFLYASIQLFWSIFGGLVLFLLYWGSLFGIIVLGVFIPMNWWSGQKIRRSPIEFIYDDEDTRNDNADASQEGSTIYWNQKKTYYEGSDIGKKNKCWRKRYRKCQEKKRSTTHCENKIKYYNLLYTKRRIKFRKTLKHEAHHRKQRIMLGSYLFDILYDGWNYWWWVKYFGNWNETISKKAYQSNPFKIDARAQQNKPYLPEVRKIARKIRKSYCSTPL